jgi:hypothetical protein
MHQVGKNKIENIINNTGRQEFLLESCNINVVNELQLHAPPTVRALRQHSPTWGDSQMTPLS